jgi:phage shock protein PspC (stress-responsive transcriptional regulator)
MNDTSIIKIARAGNVIGEFSSDSIASLIQSGTLLPTDHYWKSGMSGWALLGPLTNWQKPSLSSEPPPVPAYSSSPPPQPAMTSQFSQRTIRGRVLTFHFQSSTGFISGNDGTRYTFSAVDWLSFENKPASGLEVEFLTDGATAKSIFALGGNTSSSTSSRSSSGYYRSSDNGLLAGVCAGLAHKWNSDTILVRLGMLFIPFGIIFYIIGTTWPSKPTK